MVKSEETQTGEPGRLIFHLCYWGETKKEVSRKYQEALNWSKGLRTVGTQPPKKLPDGQWMAWHLARETGN